MIQWRWAGVALLVAASWALGSVGDPQIKTDHPWYPGELSCSTWERLFATQAALYRRVTGRQANTDEDKALASWYWRNLNYHHCTVGNEDVWDKGHKNGEVDREYWSGLFGYGFGLCFTTHHQWHGEMTRLLGPCRARTCGVSGHTTFEVFLTGGAYGQGRWALLDHDVSTVIFTPDGKRLLGLTEVQKNWRSAVKNGSRERGWLAGGLHPSDPGSYSRFKWVGYNTGYAAVPRRCGGTSGRGWRTARRTSTGASITSPRTSRARTAGGRGSTSRRRCTGPRPTPPTATIRPATATPSTPTSPTSPRASTRKGWSMSRTTT
jgi:hypothetical protein